MTAAHVFNEFLESAASILSRAGFVRAKRSFWIRSGRNIGIVNVQRSAKSTADRLMFTLNLGVWSDRVATFVTRHETSHPPAVDDCHWRERIGVLLPDREDKWWTISASDDPNVVNHQLAPVIGDVAVPAVVAHLSDEALRDEWLAGKSPGLTDLQRLMYLTILLKEIGPDHTLGRVVAELEAKSQGKPIESVVAKHVQRLGFHHGSTTPR